MISLEVSFEGDHDLDKCQRVMENIFALTKSVVMILRCTVPLAVSRIIFLSGKIELSTIELHCFVHTLHEHNEETLAVYLNAMSDIDL
ncbi:unnamed protein product [Rotaria magnacalcarata]|uniref:Uncharacterized protein n=1 Tax=Rotaria magnacalcarata TaxID=392030 RepID=A0A8S2XP43_9BILA|nr:unnamed protein product [Rotaria magnacalcarata]